MKKFIKDFNKFDLVALCEVLTKEEVVQLIDNCFSKKALVESITHIYDTKDTLINTRLERFYLKKLKEIKGEIKK